MSAIGPGDWVECISAPKGILSVGALYCVSAVSPNERPCVCHPDKSIGLRFVNGANPPQWGFWCGQHFRPIYPGGKLLKLLMEPVDGLEDAPASESVVADA